MRRRNGGDLMAYYREMAYPSPLEEGETKKRFDVSGWGRSLEERLPSMDKSLNRYFDQYMDAIVQEWDLLTEPDLLRLERRLQKVTGELSELEKGHSALAERAKALDTAVKELEGRL
jgi:hypothetical protein